MFFGIKDVITTLIDLKVVARHRAVAYCKSWRELNILSKLYGI